MPIVFIPAPWRDLTEGAPRVEVEGATVREAVDALEARFPGLKARLCRGDAIIPGLHVSVNDVMTTKGMSAPLKPESEVHFLPAIGGG